MPTLFRRFSAFLILLLIGPPFGVKRIQTADTIVPPVFKVKAENQEAVSGQREDYEKLLAEGKRLYLEEMDNDAALEVFKEAEAAASTREQRAEVSFFLSLIYYARSRDIGSQQFDRTVRRLIELDYYRELDKLLCPPRYLELFGQIKKEYGVVRVQSSPSGAEVYVDNSREAFGLTPVDIGHRAGDIEVRLRKGKAERSDTLRVNAGAETSSPVYKLKKRSSLLYIVGGVAAAGGVSAVLFLGKKEKVEPTGSIQVNSTPSGAEVFLDDRSTGQITNCTLTGVAVGSHAVEVAREGYRNERRDVFVTEGQTATVSVDLVKHTLTVTEPAAEAIWVTGEEVEIKWETGEESSVGASSASNTGLNALFNREINTNKYHIFEKPRPFPLSIAKNEGTGNRQSLAVESIDFSSRSRARFVYKARIQIAVDRLLPHPPSPWPGGDRLHLGTDGPDINGFYKLSDKGVRAAGGTGVEALTNVKIQLYEGESLALTVVDSTENSGSYAWTVSTSLQEANYSVKVFCVDEPGVEGESDEFLITPGYQFIAKWGSEGAADGQFSNTIWGIAVSGYVYVTDAENCRVQKFTSEGSFVRKWGSFGSGNGQLNEPSDVAVDKSGGIYVVDTGNNRIQKFTPDGNFVTTWGEGRLMRPQDMAIGHEGNFYVVDNHIQKFTGEGNFIASWGRDGSEDGSFLNAQGIALDTNGYIYLADTGNHRIQKFTSDGTFVTKWGALGTAEGEFNNPTKICIDHLGYVYVSDTDNHRIQKFTADGNFIMQWGGGGWQDGELNYPMGIAIDESRNVYICDTENFRVQKFGPYTTQSKTNK